MTDRQIPLQGSHPAPVNFRARPATKLPSNNHCQFSRPGDSCSRSSTRPVARRFRVRRGRRTPLRRVQAAARRCCGRKVCRDASMPAISCACSAAVCPSRTKSARSWTESGCSPATSGRWPSPLRAWDISHRSSRTHVCSRLVSTFSWRATSATRRCPSITMCAAVTRYCGVNERRCCGIPTGFTNPTSRYLGCPPCGRSGAILVGCGGRSGVAAASW